MRQRTHRDRPATPRLLSASDRDQLAHATALGRVFVTSDRDFFPIADELMSSHAPFLGIFFIQPRATIGDAVRIIAEAASYMEPPAMENRIEWVP